MQSAGDNSKMFIFSTQANQFDIIKYDVIKDADTKLETSKIGLHLLVPLFVKGKLMVSFFSTPSPSLCLFPSHSFFFVISDLYCAICVCTRPSCLSPCRSLFTNLINFIMVVILFITVTTSLCLRNRFHFIKKKKIYFVLQSGI